MIGRYLIRDENGEILAEVVPMEDHETTANARLIAAAPELLAAAKGLVECYANPAVTDQHEACWGVLDAAIAKATGGEA